MVRLFAAALALLLIGSQSWADDAPPTTPETACDRLSGMPLDRDWLDLDKPGPVYSQGETKDEVEALIFACKAAADQHPNEKRFPFRLGLALKNAGRIDEALAAFEAARRLGSVGGYDEAGSILLFGSSDEPDWEAKDPQAAAAMLDEGIARFGPGAGSQMLRNTRAYGRRWDPNPDEHARGEADLKALAEEGSIWSLVTLGRSWLGKTPELDKAAMENFRKAVELGSGDAAYRLGNALRGKDDAEMVRLYRLGVARGSDDAMNGLGFCYEYGIGVPRVGSIAADYYEMAAKRGNLVAQTNLGGLYAAGELFAADFDKARRWLEIASERGSGKASMSLGMLYDWGRGVPADLARARALYERGSAQGSAGAMNNMGYLFEHGRAAEVDYAKAREWYEKAIEAGSPDAANNLSEMYRFGVGVPKDEAKAFALSMKSAEKKNAKGINNLALAYKHGEGVKTDPVTARALLAEAVELGSMEAAHNLADMFEDGDGGERDNDQARELFRKAALAGIPNAMYRYGNRLRYDTDAGDDDAYRAALIEARNWIKRAFDLGDPHAAKPLAEMVAEGDGGPADPLEALRLYRIAAKDDDAVRLDLAERLRTGKGVPADPTEARRMFAESHGGGLTAFLEMVDRGEGGPKDPKAGTDALRRRIDAGEFALVGPLAERVTAGIGTAKDPKAAREMLERTVSKWPFGGVAFLLGDMREHGKGGRVDLPGALAAYRKAGADRDGEAMIRLARMLRAGRGAPVDKIEARRLLEQADLGANGAGFLDLLTMLDRGEGGSPDPLRAAILLQTALVVNRDARALDIVRQPGKRLSRATRREFLKLMETHGHQAPRRAETSGPLADRKTLEFYAKPPETPEASAGSKSNAPDL